MNGIPVKSVYLGPSDLFRQLGDDLSSLVEAVNMPLAELTPLSGVGYPGYRPNAFRLQFADGRILKGRRFGSASRAATVAYVSQHLEHRGFPKVLAQSGRALLMEWVEGRSLSLGDHAHDLLRDCGALQGFMHNLPVPKGSPYQPLETTQDRHVRLQQNLEELAAARVLERSEVRRAFELAIRFAPSNYAVGFVHRDFCAENLVLRPSGDVCVIDNETLALDAYDYDLGRTWYRWPMSPLQRAAYLDGYHCYRSSKDFLAHFPYWGIVALVGAAVFRLRIQASAASVPVTRLRVLLRDLKRGVTAASAVLRS